MYVLHFNHILLGDSAPAHKALVIEVLSERKKEMFYLTTHSTHYIYDYMMSDIW